MKIAAFLAAVTIGLSFAIGMIADRYGPRVADRFLERSAYTETDLRSFVATSPTAARGYAFPVLFPCDLLFMLFLGGFLAVASVAAAESIESVKRLAWLFAVGPVLYVAADLMEDVLLARMLLSPQAVTPGAVKLAQTMTSAKFITCGYALLQTIALSGAAVILDRLASAKS